MIAYLAFLSLTIMTIGALAIIYNIIQLLVYRVMNMSGLSPSVVSKDNILYYMGFNLWILFTGIVLYMIVRIIV